VPWPCQPCDSAAAALVGLKWLLARLAPLGWRIPGDIKVVEGDRERVRVRDITSRHGRAGHRPGDIHQPGQVRDALHNSIWTGLTEPEPQARGFSRGECSAGRSPDCRTWLGRWWLCATTRPTRRCIRRSITCIWCPKYRRRVLVGGVDERVKVSIGDVAAEVIEVEVMPDQVHLLAEVPPTVPLSRFVGLAKGRSSRLFRMEFPPLAPCPSGES
jgi:hypothetical protein